MPSPQRSTFQTVVFATDFSVFSQNAGLYASLLARQFGAPLLVLHAFCLSQPALEVEVMSEVKSMQRQDLEAYLARRVERLGGGNIQSRAVLVEGDPREEILRIAERNPVPAPPSYPSAWLRPRRARFRFTWRSHSSCIAEPRKPRRRRLLPAKLLPPTRFFQLAIASRVDLGLSSGKPVLRCHIADPAGQSISGDNDYRW